MLRAVVGGSRALGRFQCPVPSPTRFLAPATPRAPHARRQVSHSHLSYISRRSGAGKLCARANRAAAASSEGSAKLYIVDGNDLLHKANGFSSASKFKGGELFRERLRTSSGTDTQVQYGAGPFAPPALMPVVSVPPRLSAAVTFLNFTLSKRRIRQLFAIPAQRPPDAHCRRL